MSDVTIERVPKARLGMWLLIAGELIIFGGFIACYVLARFENVGGENMFGHNVIGNFGSEHAAGFTTMWIGALNTVILLLSSFTVVKAHEASLNNDTAGITKYLSMTIVGAVLFLTIKLGLEWRHDFHEGWTIVSSQHTAGAEALSEPMVASLFWSYYFLMTGFHGLHVVIGAVVIFIVMMGARKGKNLHRVEIAGLYWHMVDLIWIFLFPMFYLAQ